VRRKQVRQLGVKRREARADIDDQQKLRRAFDGHLRLAKNFARDGGLVVRHDSARVDDFETWRPCQGRGAVNAVARDSRARTVTIERRVPVSRLKIVDFPDIRAAKQSLQMEAFQS